MKVFLKENQLVLYFIKPNEKLLEKRGKSDNIYLKRGSLLFKFLVRKISVPTFFMVVEFYPMLG